MQLDMDIKFHQIQSAASLFQEVKLHSEAYHPKTRRKYLAETYDAYRHQMVAGRACTTWPLNDLPYKGSFCECEQVFLFTSGNRTCLGYGGGSVMYLRSSLFQNAITIRWRNPS